MPLDLDRLACFPLWPIVDGKCGCMNPTCEVKPGKHPCFLWKNLGVAEKLDGPEGCGFAIATGTRSNLFVVDLDSPDAMQWWADQCAAHDVEPWATYSVNTSRGVHLYFALPAFRVKNSAGALAKDIDVRGEGGMVCAPGTVHISGHVYAEEDANADVLDAPAWLLAWPGLQGTMRDVGEAGENAPIPVNVDTPLGMERLRAGALACATMPAAIQGANGSAAMWSIAMKLMRELELPIEAAFELVDTVYNPRCEPAWESDLILHKLENARDLSDTPTGPGKSDEEHAAFCARLRATSKQLRPNYVASRKTHNPQHSYVFTPGRSVSDFAEKPSKSLLVDAAHMLAMHKEWDGALQWDVFRRKIVAVDPPFKMDAEEDGLSDADVTGIRMWLECRGRTLEKGDAMEVITMAAKQVQFHPVIEYLESVRYAGEESCILDGLSERMFGVKDPHELLKKTLVAAVRRVMFPGIQCDTMLVLSGKQGARKSTFVRELFGAEFTRSQMPALEDKDSSLAVQGFWGIELAELDKILRAGNETVLEFLARRVDDFRAPYARCESHVPRSCVFIGTTNANDYLRDSNGHRRYWPLAVERVDLEFLRAHRDEIWGAALTLAEDKTFLHYFTDESVLKDAHEPFVTRDPWHDLVRTYLGGRERVTCEDVYRDAVCGGIADMSRYTKMQQMSITDTLKRLGCARKKTNGIVMWDVPEEIRTLCVVKQSSSVRLASRMPS